MAKHKQEVDTASCLEIGLLELIQVKTMNRSVVVVRGGEKTENAQLWLGGS